ncbi:hypothetical protein SAMN02927937_02287 [Paenimyroides aquimaris]|uniref:Uncharacterized protein n=1 Tax=Paenimyroides marinum TaxID=1159016 RepID=A0A1H6LZA2_9FLAO|nr:hypothetical protein SAMN02927937_02287 [Paenimyroides aquimaris]
MKKYFKSAIIAILVLILGFIAYQFFFNKNDSQVTINLSSNNQNIAN